jgi:hypothetical protein
MVFEIQVLDWDMHKNVAVLNRLMGFQPSTCDNWISNDDDTDINKLVIVVPILNPRWPP